MFLMDGGVMADLQGILIWGFLDSRGGHSATSRHDCCRVT
jgi:hypothetical protein